MSRWLSDEWFEEVRAVGSGLPERSGLTARIQQVITGGPDGEVPCFWVVEDGRPTSGAVGSVDAPDVTLTLSWSDAAAMVTGALDPSVAFMQGRMKVTGSMALTTGLLSASRRPECQGAMGRVAELTEF